VRCNGVARKAEEVDINLAKEYKTLEPQEKAIIIKLFQFGEMIQEAAKDYDPSLVAAYCYDLARLYHKFYHDVSILKAESEAAKAFRLQLSAAVANTLASGMDLLAVLFYCCQTCS